MSTQTKKSSDNTHKLNRRTIYLRAPLALIILLAVFLAPQRSASTQALSQDPARETPTQIEMINGFPAVAREVLIGFEASDELQLKTFADNAASLANASVLRSIGPAN